LYRTLCAYYTEGKKINHIKKVANFIPFFVL